MSEIKRVPRFRSGQTQIQASHLNAMVDEINRLTSELRTLRNTHAKTSRPYTRKWIGQVGEGPSSEEWDNYGSSVTEGDVWVRRVYNEGNYSASNDYQPPNFWNQNYTASSSEDEWVLVTVYGGRVFNGDFVLVHDIMDRSGYLTRVSWGGSGLGVAQYEVVGTGAKGGFGSISVYARNRAGTGFDTSRSYTMYVPSPQSVTGYSQHMYPNIFGGDELLGTMVWDNTLVCLTPQLDAPIGTIRLWGKKDVSDDPVDPPRGWEICDGTNGTPDLRGRFPLGYLASDGTAGTMHSTGGGSHSHDQQAETATYDTGTEVTSADDTSHNTTDGNTSTTPEDIDLPPHTVVAFIMRTE